MKKVLPPKYVTPTTYKDCLEEDLSKDSTLTAFQELVGVLRWTSEIGRGHVLLEVSLLSSHLASSRREHLEHVYQMFGYLLKKHL